MPLVWVFLKCKPEPGKKHHFTVHPESRKSYWVINRFSDGSVDLWIDGTDKYGDFTDNDDKQADLNHYCEVIAYAEIDRPAIPAIPAELL